MPLSLVAGGGGVVKSSVECSRVVCTFSSFCRGLKAIFYTDFLCIVLFYFFVLFCFWRFVSSIKIHVWNVSWGMRYGSKCVFQQLYNLLNFTNYVTYLLTSTWNTKFEFLRRNKEFLCRPSFLILRNEVKRCVSVSHWNEIQ